MTECSGMSLTKSDLPAICEVCVDAAREVVGTMENKGQLGRRLRLARESAKLSQLELAERLGVRLQTVTEREWFPENVSAGYVERLLVACGLSPDWEPAPDPEREAREKRFSQSLDEILARHSDALRRLAE